MARYQIVFGCRNQAKWGFVVQVAPDDECAFVSPQEATEWLDTGKVPKAVAKLSKKKKDQWDSKAFDAKMRTGKPEKRVRGRSDEWIQNLKAKGFHTHFGRKTFSTLGTAIVELTPEEVVELTARTIVVPMDDGVAEVWHPTWRVNRANLTPQQLKDLANPAVDVEPIDLSHLTFAQLMERVPGPLHT